ncbi:hypothetical protein M3B43_10310, partial [Nesterenkonia massiliensis]
LWACSAGSAVLCIFFGASSKRIYVTLRRYGHSEWRTSQFFGLRRHDGTFDAAGSHHVLLHTDLRIRNHDKGTTRERTRWTPVWTCYAVTDLAWTWAGGGHITAA